ncbi:hypothetical protein ACVWYH_005675 [Bradyrhizobium sp. GM24.11]
MYSAGRTFRDRARQSLEAGCDAAHPARGVLKRYYVGRPGPSREIEFVLQVLKFRLAPVELGEKHREFVHWRRPFGCLGYGHDKDSPTGLSGVFSRWVVHQHWIDLFVKPALGEA